MLFFHREGYKSKYLKAAAYAGDRYKLPPERMQALKNTLLEMALDVIQLCRENDIQIMLGGGSALGAVRHQGFIPWDDDLDLLMPRRDYDRFCKAFERELRDRYDLVAPNYGLDYKARFPKVFKKILFFGRYLTWGQNCPAECIWIFLL